MIEKGDRIAIALSGGKDSLSLLHILVKLRKLFPRFDLIALTIDEGIRGYRQEAVKLAARACEEVEVEQRVLSFEKLYGYTLDELVKIAKDYLAPCSLCGVLRRKALNVLAKSVGATKLATAHNLDDTVQTFLINVLHGDVLKIARLEAAVEEAPGFVKRIKPMYRIPESEIALYAYLRRTEFQSRPCRYVRLSMRSEVRQILNRLEVRHAGIKFTILKSVERLRLHLKSLARTEMRTCEACGEPATRRLCRACEILSGIGVV